MDFAIYYFHVIFGRFVLIFGLHTLLASNINLPVAFIRDITIAAVFYGGYSLVNRLKKLKSR